MIKATFDISFRSYAADMESHTHPFFQIVLASQGELELEIEGHSGRVDSGYVGVIGPGESHAFSARAGNRFLVIDADLQQLLSNVSSLLNKFSNERFVALTPGAQYLIGYAESAAWHSPRILETTIKPLWFELLLQSLCDDSSQKSDRSSKAVTRAKVFIDRFYSQPIRIRDVARAAGIGPSRLHVIFYDRVGITPGAYLAEVRLHHALLLLATSDMAIAEVAARTGHSDQSTLSRHMRRARDISPAAYRKERASMASPNG